MKLDARSISVRFGPLTALQEVSISPTLGQITVVLGPNAAGKSTLLRAMAGLEPIDEGEVHLGGRAMGRWSSRDRARRLCYLPQQPDVVGRFTVGDVVGFGRVAWAGRRKGGDEAVVEALSMVGLAAEIGRPYHDLSVGQRQRASLARAVLQLGDEGWMLLDEPLSAQDPGEAARLVRLLAVLRDRGHGLVLVVHDPAVAWVLADRVIVLESGRLVADGSREVVLQPDRLESIYGVEFSMGPGGPVPMLLGGSA